MRVVFKDITYGDGPLEWDVESDGKQATLCMPHNCTPEDVFNYLRKERISGITLHHKTKIKIRDYRKFCQLHTAEEIRLPIHTAEEIRLPIKKTLPSDTSYDTRPPTPRPTRTGGSRSARYIELAAEKAANSGKLSQISNSSRSLIHFFTSSEHDTRQNAGTVDYRTSDTSLPRSSTTIKGHPNTQHNKEKQPMPDGFKHMKLTFDAVTYFAETWGKTGAYLQEMVDGNQTRIKKVGELVLLRPENLRSLQHFTNLHPIHLAQQQVAKTLKTVMDDFINPACQTFTENNLTVLAKMFKNQIVIALSRTYYNQPYCFENLTDFEINRLCQGNPNVKSEIAKLQQQQIELMAKFVIGNFFLRSSHDQSKREHNDLLVMVHNNLPNEKKYYALINTLKSQIIERAKTAKEVNANARTIEETNTQQYIGYAKLSELIKSAFHAPPKDDSVQKIMTNLHRAMSERKKKLDPDKIALNYSFPKEYFIKEESELYAELAKNCSTLSQAHCTERHITTSILNTIVQNLAKQEQPDISERNNPTFS